ncbi:MAG: hypothetical protein HRT90_09095, partial [Candidatus Margulisbacteria bacterium]|nr:hypothetical protein [Candidatus Margulisiibacteriota bacterium]
MKFIIVVILVGSIIFSTGIDGVEYPNDTLENPKDTTSGSNPYIPRYYETNVPHTEGPVLNNQDKHEPMNPEVHGYQHDFDDFSQTGLRYAINAMNAFLMLYRSYLSYTVHQA